MQTRGDLDGAEQMHRKALAINEKLGRLEGMANAYANLGCIMHDREDMKRARALWLQSRNLFAKLGAQQQLKKVQGCIDSLPS